MKGSAAIGLLALAVGPALLAACAPVPPMPLVEAEAECRARPYQGVSARPSVSIGIGTGGWSGAGIGVGLSPGAYSAADPAVAYYDCVYRKSGQRPKHPYY